MAPAPVVTQPPARQQPGQVTLTIAAVLATAVTAAAAFAALAALFAALKIRPRAARLALSVIYGHPPDRFGPVGAASRTVISLNLVRQAQFVLAAAARLDDDLTRALSTGQDPGLALAAGLAREQRFYNQHLLAVWKRAQAAAAVDTAASRHGLLLGWYAVKDRRTSPECRAADGKNFRADQMPLIGYPGAVHPHCRCRPGRAHWGARLLPSVLPQRVLVAA